MQSRLFLTIIIALSMGHLCPAQSTLTDNLVLNLTFDNPLNPDESLGGQAVFFVGSPIEVQGRNGTGDKAYRINTAFEGIAVQPNAHQNFGNNDFSYGVWFKTEDLYSANKAPLTIEKWHPTFWQYRSYRLTLSERPKFEFNNSGGGNYPVTTGLNEVTDNVWTHAFVVRSGDYIKIYLNGQQKGFFYVGNVAVNSTGSDFRILGQNNQQSVLIDDVVMYSRALSDAEVDYLYNNGINNNLLTFPDPDPNTGEVGGQVDYLTVNTSDLPDGYVMSIDGAAIAESITVQISDVWPDYVFSEKYDLMDLAALRQYLQKHKHLPNIPSAKEVSQDGIDLGEMDVRLLRKIEELTLYTIDQEKRLKQQAELIESLRLQQEKLKNQTGLIKSLILRIEKLENQ